MRHSLVTRRLALAVSYAIGLTLAACSGSDHHDPTGPDPDPIPDPTPVPASARDRESAPDRGRWDRGGRCPSRRRA